MHILHANMCIVLCELGGMSYVCIMGKAKENCMSFYCQR
jgi:hypothetical protein